MTTGIETKTIQERFNHLLSLFSSNSFLKAEGLGNEVPFFICSYDPKETVEFTRIQNQLVTQLSHKGISVLSINLYDLSLDILREREILDQIFEQENDLTKDELLELLQNVLDPEQELIPKIALRIKETPHDILFITGVGEVYPYIRSHNVLNNLQSTAKDHPTVMFFPGSYTQCNLNGSALDLFSRLRDDKYYRAFNVYHCEVKEDKMRLL